jgi:hypothetical protein
MENAQCSHSPESLIASSESEWTEEELKTLEAVREQAEYIYSQQNGHGKIRVFCASCIIRKPVLQSAYKCLYCGLFFCQPCAEIHFGATTKEWVARKNGRSAV